MKRNSFLIVSKELAADKRISATAKLLLAVLLDHRNNRTGQCNPRQIKLAEELGTSEDKVQRGIVELREAGLVQMKKGQRGSVYEISIPHGCGTHSARVRNGAFRSLYEPYLLKESAHSRADPPQRKSVQSEVLSRYYAQQQRKAGR